LFIAKLRSLQVDAGSPKARRADQRQKNIRNLDPVADGRKLLPAVKILPKRCDLGAAKFFAQPCLAARSNRAIAWREVFAGGSGAREDRPTIDPRATLAKQEGAVQCVDTGAENMRPAATLGLVPAATIKAN